MLSSEEWNKFIFLLTFLLPFVSYNFLWAEYFLTDTVEILYTTDNGTGYTLSLGAQQLRSIRLLSPIVAVIPKTLLGWEVVSEEPQREITLDFPLEATTICMYSHIATNDSLLNAQVYLRDPRNETSKGGRVDQKGKTKGGWGWYQPEMQPGSWEYSGDSAQREEESGCRGHPLQPGGTERLGGLSCRSKQH